MATSKIVKPNNEAPDELEKEIAGVRISDDNIQIKLKILRY
jgi:hypothetical protein